MVALYIIMGIVAVHLLFLLSPYYRDYGGRYYVELPWTEKEYVTFKRCLKNTKAIRGKLVQNWITWPLRTLFLLLLPVIYLLDRSKGSKTGEMQYSEDGQILYKADCKCIHVKVKKGTLTIASEAFYDSMAISVHLPNTVLSLHSYAFASAHDLRRINLPDSIIFIDDYAFRYCGDEGEDGIGLREIVLPRNLHFLGVNAFYGCLKLEKLTLRGDFNWDFSWIENGNPFYLNPRLREIKSENPNFVVEKGILMSADKKILFRCVSSAEKITVPDGVESIAQGAFDSLTTMREVVLPKSLRLIGERTFCNVENLDNVILPTKLSTLGDEAFLLCMNLKTITFPLTIGDIGENVFNECRNLETINLALNADNKLCYYADKVLKASKAKRDHYNKQMKESEMWRKKIKEEENGSKNLNK